MTTEEQSIRERIFLATLSCIERDGINSMTVRGIAQEAKVNTAAINYYFGTKARLIDQVLTQTLREGLSGSLDEFEQLIETMDGDIRTALFAFLPLFFGQMVNWPRLAEAQLHDALTQQKYDGPAIGETNSFFERFLEIVRPILPTRTEPEHRNATLQLWLPMLFLGMLPRAFEEFGQTDVHSEDWRQAYVKRLLDNYLFCLGGSCTDIAKPSTPAGDPLANI
jgi:AcrR family transcriptional regulator